MDGPCTLRFFSDVIEWIDSLAKEDRESYRHVVAALEQLQDCGPAIRRPLVGAVEGSRYRNMRELRPRSGSRVNIRLLFAFDPKRRAIFLVAGNKADQRQWNAWYAKAVPEGDARYTDYLEMIKIRED